jgi:hypothetical protein
MVKQRIPNVVELGRRPDPVRYVWINKTEDDVYAGSGYRRLMANLEKYPDCELLVIDTIDDEVIRIADKEHFMREWRVHYFDTTWKYDPAAQEVQA